MPSFSPEEVPWRDAKPGGRRAWKPAIRAFIAGALLIALTVFLLQRFGDEFSALDVSLLLQEPAAAAVAAGASAAAVLLFGAAWVALAGTPAPRRRGELLSVFLASWLVRYVPGKVPALGVRLYLGRRLGFAVRPLAIATAMELLLYVAVSAGAGAVLYLGGLGSAPATAAVIAAAGGLGLGLLLVVGSQWGFRAVNAVLRRLGQGRLEREELPGPRLLLVAVGLVLGATVLNGVALYALLAVFTEVSPSDLALIAGAIALSGVAGILVSIAPSGIGVREAAIVGLLAPHFSPEAALLAALLVRVLGLAADIVLALVGSGHLLIEGFRAVQGTAQAAEDSEPDDRARRPMHQAEPDSVFVAPAERAAARPATLPPGDGA